MRVIRLFYDPERASSVHHYLVRAVHRPTRFGCQGVRVKHPYLAVKRVAHIDPAFVCPESADGRVGFVWDLVQQQEATLECVATSTVAAGKGGTASDVGAPATREAKPITAFGRPGVGVLQAAVFVFDCLGEIDVIAVRGNSRAAVITPAM